MRIKGATLQQWMLGAALVWALCWNIARASEIKDLAVTEGPTGTRAELRLDAPAKFTTLTLAGPDRLVVDLPASSLARGVHLPAGAGVVKAVRTGHPVPGTVRIVFDLALPVVALKPRIEPTPDGARLVLEWPGDGTTSNNAAVAREPASTSATAEDPIAAFATHDDDADASPPVDAAAQAAASAQATSRLIAATTVPAKVPASATIRPITTV